MRYANAVSQSDSSFHPVTDCMPHPIHKAYQGTVTNLDIFWFVQNTVLWRVLFSNELSFQQCIPSWIEIFVGQLWVTEQSILTHKLTDNRTIINSLWDSTCVLARFVLSRDRGSPMSSRASTEQDRSRLDLGSCESFSICRVPLSESTFLIVRTLCDFFRGTVENGVHHLCTCCKNHRKFSHKALALYAFLKQFNLLVCMWWLWPV